MKNEREVEDKTAHLNSALERIAIRLRFTRQILCASATAMLLLFWQKSAYGISNDWDPKFPLRMAITDRSTAADIQPRVWLVTTGGTILGVNRLVTKNADANQDPWTVTGLANVESGLDAVSFTDGSNQRQRIFYASGGVLKMLRYDNDVQSPTTSINPSTGFTLPTTDVAALTWLDGSTRRIAVVAGANQGSTTGFICYWENANLASTWSANCSTTPRLGTDHDIVGAIVSGSVQFYFRDTSSKLSRLRRTGVNAFQVDSVTTPGSGTIRSSVFAIPSSQAGMYELGVIRTSDNRVHTGRVSPTSTNPSWVQQPALPGGDTLSNTVATLGAITYSGSFFGTNYTRTGVYVYSSSLGLYSTGTTDDAGTWGTWGGPFVPGNQAVLGIGAITTTTGVPNRTPRVFTAAGSFDAQLHSSVTLQEFYNWFDFTGFRDHVRVHNYPMALGGPSNPATESSVAIGPIGLAAAIRRNNPPPWRVVMDDTLDGGSSFSLDNSDHLVQTLATSPPMVTPSNSDPNCGYGAGKMHYLDVQFDLGTNCNTALPDTTSRVVYRRGTSASVIAALNAVGPNLFQIDTVGEHDHPGLAVTEDAAGATVQVLYWRLSGTSPGVQHWKLPPTGAPIGPTAITELPANPAGILVGANKTAYGYSFQHSFLHQQVAFPKVCNLSTVPPAASSCAVVGGGTLTPKPFATRISYGTSQGSAQGDCNPSSFKCFNNAQPVSLAADRKVSNRIYAAYQAADQDETSIYFTKSSGGSSFGSWSAAVRIHAHDTNDYFIDPTISVDDEGTLFVTYTKIRPAPLDTSGQASVLITWSIDGGTTWLSAIGPLTGWNAKALPFHCGRNHWFLGEYRYPWVVGSRAYHLVQFGTSSLHQQMGAWLSRWFVFDA